MKLKNDKTYHNFLCCFFSVESENNVLSSIDHVSTVDEETLLTKIEWNEPEISEDKLLVNNSVIDKIFLYPGVIGRKIVVVSVSGSLEMEKFLPLLLTRWSKM